ncbi:MAG: hypothetical protein QGH25_05295, partial [Candidatus Latescibacteria bacterium]|nr:hypothetical protein [Candidatus Latescibacterota bacterium]
MRRRCRRAWELGKEGFEHESLFVGQGFETSADMLGGSCAAPLQVAQHDQAQMVGLLFERGAAAGDSQRWVQMACVLHVCHPR